jgi:hypothetical protein
MPDATPRQWIEDHFVPPGAAVRASPPQDRLSAACAAMQGILANGHGASFDEVAQHAVAHADALLARLAA